MTPYPLTAEATETAAEALATACNGGEWGTDYAPKQREVWRQRVRRAVDDPMKQLEELEDARCSSNTL